MIQNKIDIMLLQETHILNRERIDVIQKGINGKVYTVPGRENARGVTIIVVENNEIKNSKIKFNDTEGNLLCVELEIEDKKNGTD